MVHGGTVVGTFVSQQAASVFETSLCVSVWVLSRCSDFLTQSEDMLVGLTEDSK